MSLLDLVERDWLLERCGELDAVLAGLEQEPGGTPARARLEAREQEILSSISREADRKAQPR